jgi:WhiB family transcriptional regulator, redox-sensing transcriptional regulator
VSETWRDRALCAEVGTELFFPRHGESLRPAQFVCRRCPVTDDCLAFALAHMTCDDDIGQHGVWGGTSVEDRRRKLGQRPMGGTTAARRRAAA